MSSAPQGFARQFDQLAVADVIVRERRARDAGRYAEMVSYYLPDAEIETSWFKGSGEEFVAQTERQAASVKSKGSQADVGFHGIGATVATVRGDRAIADTDCTLNNFYLLDGIACKYTGYVRLLFRLVRVDGAWRIKQVHCVYIRDLLVPCNPNRVPVVDEAELSTYRASYANLCYQQVRAGLKPQNDLPGVDRPDTVAAVQQSEQDWLSQD